MSGEWLFKSETYDNCNCAVNCGCQYNIPTTHGCCEFAYVGRITDGHYNGTPIAGLNWSLICKYPGEIAEGNGKRLIVIDERADEVQRIALETIISGQECAPMSNIFHVFGSMCTEFCDTKFLPIHVESDLEGRTAKVEIPGVLTSRAQPMVNPFNNEPFHIGLARPKGSFEFTYAEIGEGSTEVTGEMEMSFQNTWAMFCIHHYDQDGMVRERSRLTAWIDD